MKTICLLFILILTSNDAFAQNTKIREAQAMYKNYWLLYNSKDFDSLSNYWHEDVQGFIANHIPFLLNGKSDFVELHNDLKNVSYLNMTLKDLNYTIFGETVVTCSSYYTWRIIGSDGFEIVSGRHTALLIKSEDGWKLANMHFSKIFPN